METAVILGAGFSYVAGLPLTRQLFQGTDLPQVVSLSSAQADKEVLTSYNYWANRNSTPNAETWMAELYQERNNPLQPMFQGTTWDDAVRFALRRLVTLPKGKHAPYYYGISTYKSHPIHSDFWLKCKEELGTRYVVTMNYDILPEQALHISKGTSRSSPSCYYGGFQHTQVVKKMTNVIKGEYELLELGHEIVLYKLHGSLNWAWEKHSPTMKMHDDVRAVFRHGDSVGVPAIIPPIPEKEMPLEFSQIWLEAERSLLKCDNWLVCGYSLPIYDYALKDYFKRILTVRDKTQIVILDPCSKELETRWIGLAPSKVITKALPGIPDSFKIPWC